MNQDHLCDEEWKTWRMQLHTSKTHITGRRSDSQTARPAAQTPVGRPARAVFRLFYLKREICLQIAAHARHFHRCVETGRSFHIDVAARRGEFHVLASF